MAEKLEEFPGGGIPTRAKYPWGEWLDGSPWLLRKGEDYLTNTDSFRAVANKAARDRDKKLKTRTIKDDEGEGIAIQALSGFQAGDPIWILDDDEGKAKGLFLRAGEQAEGKTDPKLGVLRDIAWVETEEGEVEQRFYRQIKARD
jgi:hypothetical protein